MISDIFIDKKSVHFKLDTDVHRAMRAKLFKYNISMQELFDEFSRMVVSEAPRAHFIVESIVSKKLRSTLSDGPTSRRKKKALIATDLEVDALYNMINEADDL